MNSPTHQTHLPRALRTRSGSALLLTLLVTSLLLVIVMTLIILVRTELRKVIQHQEMLVARANARLGLELAVSQLQQTLGPDTRVSATAGIGSLGDPALPNNGIRMPATGARHWTGAWGNLANPRNEAAPGDDARPSFEPEFPQLLNWLVSGNERVRHAASVNPQDFGRITAAPEAPAAAQLAQVAPWAVAPANTGPIPVHPALAVTHSDGTALQTNPANPMDILVGGQPGVLLVGGNRPVEDFIAAPRVSLAANARGESAGSYAWWVGDEGVKARLELQEVLSGGPPLLAMQRPGQLNPALNHPGWETDWAQMNRLSSTDQLRFAPGGAELLQDHFHDFTTFSMGVLADSAKGGLRRDLTAGFRMTAPPAEIALSQPLIHLPTARAPATLQLPNRKNLTRVQWSGDAPASGTLPPWANLRRHYRLQDELTGERPMLPPRVGSDQQEPFFPIATRVHYHVHAAIVNGRAYVLHLPSVVLWNPTNVRMAPAEFWFNIELNYHQDPDPSYQANFGRGFPALLVAHGPVAGGQNPNNLWADETYRRDIMVAGRGASTLIRGSERMQSHSDQGFRFLLRMTEPLEPGEARVFSPLEPTELSANPAERVLIDGFSENTWFHERIPLDREIGSHHVFRVFLSWPLGRMNRPSRYAYGLGNSFSESTQLRRVDGITGPGYHNPGSVVNTLKIRSPGLGDVDPFHPVDNPLITGAANFPENHDGRASARDVVNWLTSLNPDLPGGQFPPNFAPFGWDYKLQMALPTNLGEPAGMPDVHMRWLGQHNPLTESLGAALTDAQGHRGMNNHAFFPMNLVGSNSTRKRVFDAAIDFPDSEGATFVGGSHFLTSPLAPSRLIVRDLPRRETGLMSLAALSNANVHPRRGQISSESAYTAAAMPAFPISNALADPRIHPGDIDGFPDNWNATMGDGPFSWGNPRSDAVNRRLHFDLSYLLNRTLFDRYFFSTVPRSGSTDSGFANPLIRPDRAGHPPERLRDFEQAAAHLRLHGAFNINSTSVEAWTALLASFRGQALPGTDAVGDLSPFPRALFPLEDPLENAGSGNLTFQANRFRRLSDAEIRALAESIVSEIRARGPSLSLAGFVNRRPQALASASPAAAAAMGRTHGNFNSNNPLERRTAHQALLGTLQHAIDRVENPSGTQPGTATGINDRLRTWLNTGNGSSHQNNTALINQPWIHRPAALGFEESMTPAQTSLVMPDAPLALRASAVGMPGYLTQADLLRALAPVLSARSDTFRIRFFGEYAGSRAWGEAIVQRTAEHLDPETDPDASLHPRLTSTASQTFGRRFEIVSFAWITPEAE